MGRVEIQDQILGLKAASEAVDFIDMSRVGIMGWSYGGFLSLVAIAEYPSLFKVKKGKKNVLIFIVHNSRFVCLVLL